MTRMTGTTWTTWLTSPRQRMCAEGKRQIVRQTGALTPVQSLRYYYEFSLLLRTEEPVLDEAYLSTKSPPPKEDAWLPCQDEHAGRSPGAQQAPGEGAPPSDRLRVGARDAAPQNAQVMVGAATVGCVCCSSASRGAGTSALSGRCRVTAANTDWSRGPANRGSDADTRGAHSTTPRVSAGTAAWCPDAWTVYNAPRAPQRTRAQSAGNRRAAASRQGGSAQSFETPGARTLPTLQAAGWSRPRRPATA